MSIGVTPGPFLDVDALSARLPARPLTRFAPAPTGWLHLGHVLNAIYVWGLAQATCGDVVLRIEDHDLTRSRDQYVDALMRDLDWLGLRATRALPGTAPWRQRDHQRGYELAVDSLTRSGDSLFYCACSRRVLQDSTASSAGRETPYPMTCRHRGLPDAPGHRLRWTLPDTPIHFVDGRWGAVEQHPATQCGAVMVRDRDRCWTYQFAVSVDDTRHHIDLVVRGDDLLDSTGRQMLLAQALGRTAPPVFVHHPLLRHPDGQKLSKSLGDTGIAVLRERGWTPSRVFGHAAWRAGLLAHERPIAVEAFAAVIAGHAAR